MSKKKMIKGSIPVEEVKKSISILQEKIKELKEDLEKAKELEEKIQILHLLQIYERDLTLFQGLLKEIN